MAKEFRFPTDVTWVGGRRTAARVEGKQTVRVATPPEFRGTDPELWSPEDMFVAAAGSCLAVTIAAIAEHDEVPLRGLEVHAEGVVGRRPDNQFGFVRIEQAVTALTDAGFEDAVRSVVDRAERTCLVSVSLDLPVETAVDIRAEVPQPQY